MDLFTFHMKGRNSGPRLIESSEEDYEYFARSGLSRIGRSRNRRLLVAGEKAVLPLVELTSGIRRSLIAETEVELVRWLDVNRKSIGLRKGPLPDIHRLEILFSLRELLKDKKFQFFQRIHD